MYDWKAYRKTGIIAARPYEAGEILDDEVSISKNDKTQGSPRVGDMIARDPENPSDAWLINADYFEEHYQEAYTKLWEEIMEEYHDAAAKFDQLNSYHEGYAVLQEEVDELWEEIKGDQDLDRMRNEAIQVAAMGVRFLKDLDEMTGDPEGPHD